MQIESYLERIGHAGPARADLETLRAIHRAHMLAIAYENLDIHLGRRLTLDEEQIFEKIVARRRGGWCYEMNGLLAWALRQIGFDVRMLAGTVGRAPGASPVEGNHLVLLVDLGEAGRHIADVGFGNGFLEPIPLEPGEHRQGFLSYRLAEEGGRWHFTNHAHGGPGYDMTLEPHRLEDFAQQCDWLQTSPDSGFVRSAVCHRHTPDGIISLRGAVLTEVRAGGVATTTAAGAEEFAALVEGRFGLRVPEAASLWPRVWERHQAWLAEQAARAR